MEQQINYSVRFQQILALVKKNLELYFYKGPVVIFGILFPFFMALAWIIGRPISELALFSGILGMAVFFTATSISPVVFPNETREKNLELTLSTPTTLLDLILGIGLASTLFSFVISFCVYVILSIILNISFWIVGWVILGSFLLCWSASFLGILISALPTDMVSNVMVIATLVKFPLIFISGIFLPLETLPTPLFVVSLFSPVTYFVDLLKSSLNQGTLGIGLDLTGLLVTAVIFTLLAYMLHKKTILKRF